MLNNERGEANYFSTVVFIFIAVLLLAFIIDLFSIISTKQELDHAADQMVKQIQLSGGVNGETDELFEFLSSQIEGAENISYSIDATYSDEIPSYPAAKYSRKNGLIERLQGGKCELCGQQTDNVKVHHVRKLKELAGMKEWERKMVQMNRKTLVVCNTCYGNITGK